MRSIRIRHWSTITKNFSPPITIEQLLIVTEAEAIKSGKEISRILPYWTTVQSTDLFDKKGQEIWEGDIVECDGNRYIICWYLAQLCAKNEKSLYLTGAKLNECTVVGNIYETKI